MKTAAQVRRELADAGISITEWAMKRGIPPSVVVDLLAGKTKAKRGMAHKAAVALGMKRAS
jgi:gp16 family phage-associated protein